MSEKQSGIAETHKKGIESQNEEELLWTDIDSALTFENHNDKIYKKTSIILKDLVRTFPYMTLEKKRAVMKVLLHHILVVAV